jgi:DNA modification methylase
MQNSKISEEILNKVNDALSKVSPADNNQPGFVKQSFTFQGKKSEKIAEKIISNCFQPGAKAFDPFFGSGSFLMAAAKSGLSVTGTELDNYTFSFVRTILQKVDLDKTKELFAQVSSSVKEKVMFLYETECCGEKNYILRLYFDPETREYYHPKKQRDILNGKNIKLVNKCPLCGSNDKFFEKVDEDKISYCDSLDTSRFPSHSFIENSRINITVKTGADKYDRNFTNRAKSSLLFIQDAINSLPSSNERDVLEQALVSSLALAKIAMYGSGTDNLYHVIRYEGQESNVWILFEEKFDQIFKYISYLQKEGIALNDNFQIFCQDYRAFLNEHSDLIFDLIYTDPPYTDQCPYLEKSQYFRDWIQKFYDPNMVLTADMLQDEVVITNAPSRKNKAKTEQYLDDIDQMFCLFNRHLKENGLVFFTIKLGKKKYFNILSSFISYARKNGFEFLTQQTIEVKDPTIRKQAAFINTISMQVVLVFQKLNTENAYWFIENDNFEEAIIKMVYRAIKSSTVKRLDMTQALLLVKRYALEKYNLIFGDSELLRAKKIIDRKFNVYQEYLISLNPNIIYFGLDDKENVFSKLYDYIPLIVRKLTKNNKSFTMDDLYFELGLILFGKDENLFSQLRVDKKYSSEIENLLDNYCIKTENNYILRKYENIKNDGAQDVSQLDGYEFERLITNLLQKMGYKDAARIGGAGDLGVDIIAKKIINNKTAKVIFQCKCWCGGVGSDPIQRLHSMLLTPEYDFKEAWCVTTSWYTKDGIDVAKSSGVKIINGEELMVLLDQYFPGQYFNRLIKKN